ncbi:unnamed protein product [Adineta steineri]|uniref:Uncharacterized protein n=1 Tax=Adineta steineri TaxID=433720 RepID=A0A819C9C0_9BILA|nr:unnamed protein product [Adineta steineri]CAF3814050.1 unnamed protein product [Adineta steineri]
MDPLPLGRCNHKNSLGTSLGQCNRWAILVCLHCNQGVCLEHHKIHQHEIQIRADKLNNRINDLRQILHRLTYEQMIDNSQEKLNQWVVKCKNEIDLKHAYMSKQLSNTIKQVNIDEFCSLQINNINHYIEQPLVDLLQTSNNIEIKQVESLEQQLEQIQNMVSFIQITDDGELKLNQSISLNNNYSSLLSLSKHSLNNCPGAMAGSSLSHNYLLIFQMKPYFSLVFIENNKLISRTPIDSFVYDICWSESTQIFLIATEQYIYEFNPLNNCLLQSYKNSQSTQILWSLACYLTDIYIVYKPDMILCQHDFKKSYEKKTQWNKCDIMCEKGDQTIGCIRINEQKQILALSIKQIDNQWRVDLFSLNNVQRLHNGSSFNILNENNLWRCMMTPLLNNENQWLIQNYETILLDENSQVVNRIDHNGYNVTLINRDKIAFLDHDGIQMYQR